MRSNRLNPLLLACIAMLSAGCAGNSTNATPPTAAGFRFTEAAGTFYKDYTGPQRPAISAIGADGAYSPAAQTITVLAKMAGPVFNGGPNYYVWGWDRGSASTKTAPFPDEPAVKFDAVMVVTADPASGVLTGSINLLNGAPAQPVTPVLAAADTIAVTFPASMLPTTGATSPQLYTWNLWPRSGLGGTPAAQIASFIPDNQMASLQTQ